MFPNEDAIDEEDRYDSVTETETSVSCCVTLGNKWDSTQDEDSDLDEGSCGDAEGADKTDALSEAYRVCSYPYVRHLGLCVCVGIVSCSSHKCPFRYFCTEVQFGFT